MAVGLVFSRACYYIFRLTRGEWRGGQRLRLHPSLTCGPYDHVLKADRRQKLLPLLESTASGTTGSARVPLGSSAASSAQRVTLLGLGGTPPVGSKAYNPNHSVKG